MSLDPVEQSVILPLKPCPFCGNDSPRSSMIDIGPNYQTSSVWCGVCPSQVSKSGLDAVDLWNKRKTESHLRTLLQEIGCCPAELTDERYVSIQVPHDLLKEIVQEGFDHNKVQSWDLDG